MRATPRERYEVAWRAVRCVRCCGANQLTTAHTWEEFAVTASGNSLCGQTLNRRFHLLLPDMAGTVSAIATVHGFELFKGERASNRRAYLRGRRAEVHRCRSDRGHWRPLPG